MPTVTGQEQCLGAYSLVSPPSPKKSESAQMRGHKLMEHLIHLLQPNGGLSDLRASGTERCHRSQPQNNRPDGPSSCQMPGLWQTSCGSSGMPHARNFSNVNFKSSSHQTGRPRSAKTTLSTSSQVDIPGYPKYHSHRDLSRHLYIGGLKPLRD